ncbi:MAG: TRAP transporter large permease [Syntrophales bacterium]
MIALAGCAIFLVMLAIGFPVSFAMGIIGTAGIMMSPDLGLGLIPERMHSFTDSFVFTAIPMFILSGALMDRSGITQRLMGLAMAIVGHIRGGLAMVTVVAEMLFSGISGSAAADVSAMCSMAMPGLAKAKYPASYSLAVICASSAMGVLIPPCIQMIILGGLANVSVVKLFVGGIVPAVVLALLLLLLIYIDARRYGFPAERKPTLKELGKIIVDSIIPLGMPVIIFGGIFGGIFTPTEAGAVTVLYALLADRLVYKALRWNDIVDTFISSAAINGMIMFIVAAASVLSYLLSYMLIPEMITNLCFKWGLGPFGFMMFNAFVFLVAALIIEPIPAMVIFVPVLAPVAVKLGIDMVYFGTIIIAALGIGMFIPPIGMGVILACSIGKVPVEETIRPLAPFIAMLLVGLVILILFPQITTFLPNLLMR